MREESIGVSSNSHHVSLSSGPLQIRTHDHPTMMLLLLITVDLIVAGLIVVGLIVVGASWTTMR
jgi:hypothetical protein